MNVDFRPVDHLTSVRRDALRTNTCAFGKGPEHTFEFRDEASRREYKISGMCAKCQDDFFGVQ